MPRSRMFHLLREGTREDHELWQGKWLLYFVRDLKRGSLRHCSPPSPLYMSSRRSSSHNQQPAQRRPRAEKACRSCRRAKQRVSTLPHMYDYWLYSSLTSACLPSMEPTIGRADAARTVGWTVIYLCQPAPRVQVQDPVANMALDQFDTTHRPLLVAPALNSRRAPIPMFNAQYSSPGRSRWKGGRGS